MESYDQLNVQSLQGEMDRTVRDLRLLIIGRHDSCTPVVRVHIQVARKLETFDIL